MTDPVSALRALGGAAAPPADAGAALEPPPAADAPEKARRPHRATGQKPTGRPPGSGAGPRPSSPAPAIVQAAQDAAEKAAAAEREKGQAERVRAMLAGPLRAEFAAALADLYALPFEAFAVLGDVPGARLTAERKLARGQLCVLVIEAYGGNWIRHLPAIMLAGAFVADSGLALAAYQEQRKERRARLAGTPAPAPAAAVSVAAPAAAPGPAAS